MRMGEYANIPFPNEDFKKSALLHYEIQWKLSMQILKILGIGLEIPFEKIYSLLTTESIDYKASQNTNLCMFRYFDAQNYTVPQKCMVHQDKGLLTLLPRASFPGLEILDFGKIWILIEEFTDNDDVIVFGGRILEKISGGYFTPIRHRVVRFPKKERLSMPFEVQSNDDAILENLAGKEAIGSQLTDEQSKKMTTKEFFILDSWERVQQKVSRTDIILQEDAE